MFKKIVMFVAVASLSVAASVMITGCSMFSDADSTGTAATITEAVESAVDTAVDVAATTLSSDAVQVVAITAAENYIAENVEDETLQEAANAAIESAVPALAEAIAAVASDSTETVSTETTAESTTEAKKIKALSKFRALVKSDKLAQIKKNTLTVMKAYLAAHQK